MEGGEGRLEVAVVVDEGRCGQGEGGGGLVGGEGEGGEGVVVVDGDACVGEGVGEAVFAVVDEDGELGAEGEFGGWGLEGGGAGDAVFGEGVFFKEVEAVGMGASNNELRIPWVMTSLRRLSQSQRSVGSAFHKSNWN